MLFMLASLVMAEPDSGTCLSVQYKSREEKEAEIAEAEKEFAESAPKNARVLVMKWPKTTTDYTDANLKLNVQSAINRADITLLPVVDLYQGGRVVPNTQKKPKDQKGRVPNSAINDVLFHVQESSRIYYDDISPDDWKLKAQELEEASHAIWFVDRPELRDPLVQMYSEIGRAANNVDPGELTAPFFQSVGGQQVNYYWFLAAQFVSKEQGLLSSIPNDESRDEIENYANDIRNGRYPTMKLDFQMEDVFKKNEFDEEFQVLINGLPTEIDQYGQIEILLGITDIFVQHKEGGYGLADRYEARTDDRAYNVLDDARKSLTTSLVRQLFEFENECKPKVSPDIITHLATYSLLHPQVRGEVYIAVPKNGNPHQMWIWRYDPDSYSLSRVANGSDDFPINFVGTVNVGGMFSGVNLELTPPTSGDVADAADLSAIPATVPVGLELRLHYTRFMLNFGVEFAYSANGEWEELYPSNEDKTQPLGCENATGECPVDDMKTHTVAFNQTNFIGLGYLFGRDAATGLGPRAGIRAGWSSLPNAVTTTAHFGWTLPAPKMERINKRIQLIVDADFRIGATIGRSPSLLLVEDDEGNVPRAALTFGFTAGAGSTF